MIDERIAERRAEIRQERRRRRLRRTIVVVVVVAAVVGFVALDRSALVGLEEVQVTGVERLDPDRVRDAAGLELGTSTLRLGLDAAAERVERLPRVRTAELARVDPLTVRIDVRERIPALVAEGGGRRVLVDRDGVVVGEGDLDGLPRIRLAGAPPEPGTDVAADVALANAHTVWRALSGPLRAQVNELHAAGRDELTLRFASGVEVRFGRAERLPEKVRALGAVLEDVGATPIEAVDVRAPSAPVVIGTA